MPIGIKQKFLPISIFCLICSTAIGLQTKAGGVTNGADVYCFMRNGGNSHEPSWQAAYQFLKSKEQGLFKTSPRKAASMIVEEVVQDPIKYENCIGFLGDMYADESTSNKLDSDNELQNDKKYSSDSLEKSPKGKYIDRYNY